LGGGSPGINAAIRLLVHTVINYEIEVIGLGEGYPKNDIMCLTLSCFGRSSHYSSVLRFGRAKLALEKENEIIFCFLDRSVYICLVK